MLMLACVYVMQRRVKWLLGFPRNISGPWLLLERRTRIDTVISYLWAILPTIALSIWGLIYTYALQMGLKVGSVEFDFWRYLGVHRVTMVNVDPSFPIEAYSTFLVVTWVLTSYWAITFGVYAVRLMRMYQRE